MTLDGTVNAVSLCAPANALSSISFTVPGIVYCPFLARGYKYILVIPLLKRTPFFEVKYLFPFSTSMFLRLMATLLNPLTAERDEPFSYTT